MNHLVIAIDGPAASGKGTLARKLAQHFSLLHLDSGLMYRAIGLMAQSRGVPFDQEDLLVPLAESLTLAHLQNPDLRGDQAGTLASFVAMFPKVRQVLVAFQRQYAHAVPAPYRGIVMDGRDIGTVVLPGARFKFFIDADLDTRSQRRHTEFQDKGQTKEYQEVWAQMQARDARDKERKHSPLEIAPDAVVIDASRLDIDEVFDRAVAVIAQAISSLQQEPTT